MKNLSEVRMLQCVFGTSICNLSCLYCGWPKRLINISNLEEKEATKRIVQMHNFMKVKLPNCNIFAITGGEPLLFPVLIKAMLDVFKDIHVKISTNALNLNKDYLKMFKRHGNVSLCISLDGSTFNSNRCRYKNKQIFDLVVKNIEEALADGFLVEISCVLNKYNIDEFGTFCQWIDKKWSKYIDQVVLIAYPITTYTRIPGEETKYMYGSKQAQKLVNYLRQNIEKIKILSQTPKYYYDLADFLENKLCKEYNCQKYKWCLTVEYVDCSLWKSGNLISYGCGTKGDKSLGMFNLEEKIDQDLLVERKNSKFTERYFQEGFGECQKHCFTNWHMIDMLYRGSYKHTLPKWCAVYSHKKYY